MKKRKILLIGPMPPPAGGVSVHLKRLLSKSRSHQQLSLAVLDLRKLKIYFSDNSIGNIFTAFRYFLSAQIIHVHYSHQLKLLIARIGRLFGKSIFFSVHNPRDLQKSSTQKMVRLSDKIIFVFDPGQLPENGFVIPAYIQSDDDRPLPAELKSTLKNYKHKIVSVSSYSGKEKMEKDVYGFDIILNAIGKISEPENTVLVLVDSNGKLRERYDSIIINVQKESGVRIIYIDYDINFLKLLSQSDVFIRATRSDGDALSVREALYAGVAVLAADGVTRPEGCVLFKNEDDNDLAIKLNSLLTKKEKRIYRQGDFAEEVFEIYQASMLTSD